MDYIKLTGIHIYANHGCLDEEKILGAEFLINIKAGLDLSIAGKTGKIEDTVNYAEIYALVLEEMKIQEKILEKVAYRIAIKIMRTFPKLKSIEFSLAKLHPPLPGEIDRTEIIVHLNRNEV